MDNMQRSVLVRRFLLLLGDLHTHQLRPKPLGNKDQLKCQSAQYDSVENSWYPKVPAALLGKDPNVIMKQAGVAQTRCTRMRIVTVVFCANR